MNNWPPVQGFFMGWAEFYLAQHHDVQLREQLTPGQVQLSVLLPTFDAFIKHLQQQVADNKMTHQAAHKYYVLLPFLPFHAQNNVCRIWSCWAVAQQRLHFGGHHDAAGL